MVKTLLLVALGGAVGAVLRALVTLALQPKAPPLGLPWGTVAANLLGCLAIGLLAGFGESRGPLSPETRALLVTGVLGGFTTFSTYAYETTLFAREGQAGAALGVALGQLAFGVGAVLVGLKAGRAL